MSGTFAADGTLVAAGANGWALTRARRSPSSRSPPGRRGAAHPVHLRGADLRWPQLDSRVGAVPPRADPRVRGWCSAGPRCSCSSRAPLGFGGATSRRRCRTSPSSSPTARARPSASTPPAATSSSPSPRSSCRSRSPRWPGRRPVERRPALRARRGCLGRAGLPLHGGPAQAKADPGPTAGDRPLHPWPMALLYIGTFGSFIGYSAAFPTLLRWSSSAPTSR